MIEAVIGCDGAVGVYSRKLMFRWNGGVGGGGTN